MSDSANRHADHEREHERHEVEIRVDWSATCMYMADRVTNISKGGLFIRSETPMELGTDVKMILWLPGRMPIRAIGRVVRNQDVATEASPIAHGSGLQFTVIPGDDGALLHDYLHELAAGTPPARGH